MVLAYVVHDSVIVSSDKMVTETVNVGEKVAPHLNMKPLGRVSSWLCTNNKSFRFHTHLLRATKLESSIHLLLKVFFIKKSLNKFLF